jgi:hypothetical protein
MKPTRFFPNSMGNVKESKRIARVRGSSCDRMHACMHARVHIRMLPAACFVYLPRLQASRPGSPKAPTSAGGDGDDGWGAVYYRCQSNPFKHGRGSSYGHASWLAYDYYQKPPFTRLEPGKKRNMSKPTYSSVSSLFLSGNYCNIKINTRVEMINSRLNARSSHANNLWYYDPGLYP